jgi:hypothetical protein|tara:strand:- start:1628 stop:2551 length:924 start_codon:yes stop_codon:yes gene_type:complete
MKPQFQHTLVTSFYLWFDNYLQDNGEAYKNKTGIFYNMTDDRLDSNYNVYSSPYKQFIIDSGLHTNVVNSQGTEGAIVIDRISGQRADGSAFEVTRGTSGLKIDYENGRVFFTGDENGELPGNNLSLSGQFGVKDFNVYVTNQTEEDLVVENKFKTNDRFGNLETSGVLPYDQVIPAVFITSESINNQPFAFGGLDVTQTNVKAVVMTSDLYCLDCVLSLAADSKKQSFVEVDFNDFPVTEFGDIKTATYPTGYSYNQIETDNTQELFHIEEVFVSKLSDRVKKKVNPNIFVGFIDFEIHKYRRPRG